MKTSKMNKVAPKFGPLFVEIITILSIQKFDFFSPIFSLFYTKNIGIFIIAEIVSGINNKITQ